MSQTVRTCKGKKKIHNGKFIEIKVHLYFKPRLVTINGVLGYIIKSIQYKQFPQCTQYKQYPRKEKMGKKMGMEEKAVDLKKKKKKKRWKGDKGERHNEKKTRRRRRGEKDGDRGERKKKKL